MKSYAEKALLKLQDAISSGELRPNQRLVEMEISKKLGISRTPLREALIQLEIIGNVTPLPKGGVAVTECSPKVISDIVDIRKALDTMTLGLACKRVNKNQITSAQKYLKLIDEAWITRDYNQYNNNNINFHKTLRASCDNNKLVQLTAMFTYQYFDKRIIQVMNDKEANLFSRQHTKLLEALCERNVEKIQKTITEHLQLFSEIANAKLL
jgi:DNA-binding GntR family transcriptional regulator